MVRLLGNPGARSLEVAKYLSATGELVAEFGDDGRVLLANGDISGARFFYAAFSDHHLVIALHGSEGGSNSLLIISMLPDGTLDPSLQGNALIHAWDAYEESSQGPIYVYDTGFIISGAWPRRVSWRGVSERIGALGEFQASRATGDAAAMLVYETVERVSCGGVETFRRAAILQMRDGSLRDLRWRAGDINGTSSDPILPGAAVRVEDSRAWILAQRYMEMPVIYRLRSGGADQTYEADPTYNGSGVVEWPARYDDDIEGAGGSFSLHAGIASITYFNQLGFIVPYATQALVHRAIYDSPLHISRSGFEANSLIPCEEISDD